ncbi:MAG: DNA repair protein RecO [bacterium]
MLYKTQGIIIKQANLGETDRLLNVYTKDFGKILIKAKSVRKNQAKLKGHLELFLYSDLMIAPARGFDIITSAETIDGFQCLRKNLSCLSSAYYISELTDKMIAGTEKDDNLWFLLLNSFQRLNEKEQNIKPIIKNFENSLLELLGYGYQKNPLLFIQSLLNQRIKSFPLLLEFL